MADTAAFVRCEDGSLLNLSKILKCSLRSEVDRDTGKHFERAFFWNEQGTCVATAVFYDRDPDLGLLTSPIVQNSTGVVGYLVDWAPLRTGERPTEQDLVTTLLPVVGWRVQGIAAIPVLPEHPPASSRGRIVLRLQDGTVLWPNVATYASLDEVKSEMLSWAQERWDATQAERSPPQPEPARTGAREQDPHRSA